MRAAVSGFSSPVHQSSCRRTVSSSCGPFPLSGATLQAFSDLPHFLLFRLPVRCELRATRYHVPLGRAIRLLRRRRGGVD